MAGRRTSWVEVETETGEKYFYDDPNLGGTGVTQWDAPEEIQDNNNEKGQAPQKNAEVGKETERQRIELQQIGAGTHTKRETCYCEKVQIKILTISSSPKPE